MQPPTWGELDQHAITMRYHHVTTYDPNMSITSQMMGLLTSGELEHTLVSSSLGFVGSSQVKAIGNGSSRGS
jgi:hypothetical protein